MKLKNWSDHSCLWVWSLPDWEDCVIIISLPMPWVCLLCQHVCQHAREVCQHARGSSQMCLSFPGGSQRFLEVPDVLKAMTLCHCTRWLKNPQDCTYGIIFTWNGVICLFNLSCDGLLAVGTVKERFIVYHRLSV